MTQRYILDIDPNCCYVLVPVEHRRKWLRWVSANDQNADYTLPAYAIPLRGRCRGDGSAVTFTDPADLKGNPLT
jgi:hypothetical protein